MDPADTVNSFYSSSSPTPNPHPSTHFSSIQPSSESPNMVGQVTPLAEPISQVQQLMASTVMMQQQLASLMPRDGRAPVDLAASSGDPDPAPVHAASSPESASAAQAA
jgi:hypothetical protein